MNCDLCGSTIPEEYEELLSFNDSSKHFCSCDCYAEAHPEYSSVFIADYQGEEVLVVRPSDFG